MTSTALARVCAVVRLLARGAAAVAVLLMLALAPAIAAAQSQRIHRPRRRPRCLDGDARIGQVPHGDTERATLCLLNAQRARFGLPGLRGSAKLERSAQLWTNDMIEHRDFSHGTAFGARISATGFRWSQIGENIAFGFRTPAQTVTAWMRSRGHCQNILSPEFSDAGTGFARPSVTSQANSGGTWTLDLALPSGRRAPSGRWTPAEGCPYH